VKPGARALGIAESYRETHSTLAGTVVRADRVVDGLVFGSCTVGGTDATDAVCTLVDRLDREDVHCLLVAGIAPAWYNVLDLHEIHDRTGLPALSVSFEESDGLAGAIRSAFDGRARRRRLARYRAQPDRQPVTVGEDTVHVRSVGTVDVPATLRAFTPEGGRPEPVRIARQAARAADRFRRECELL